MDPQVCFNELMEALEEQNHEVYEERFQNLADWLMNGGFAPIVNDLGTIKHEDAGILQGATRVTINDFPLSKSEINYWQNNGFPDFNPDIDHETHSIQLIDPVTPGPYRFEFCVWKANGKLLKKFPLGY